MPKGLRGFQKGELNPSRTQGVWNKGTKGICKPNSGSFKKGYIPWIKGKELGFIPIGAFKKGHTPWSKGKKLSRKHREKLSEAHKGQVSWIKGKHIQLNNALEEYQRKHGAWNKGKKCPQLGGENHYCWKGGITPTIMKIRNSFEMREWRKKVYKKDNYTCWICEIRGGEIHAHHLKKFSNYPKLRFKVSNGLTLCEFCHKTYTEFGNILKGRRN